MSRLRLVKVVCQPHFVLEDDGDNLTEQVAQPVPVAAKDWPTYATKQFLTDVEALEKQLTSAENVHDET